MNRPAVLAGTWYPKTASACHREIQEILESIKPGPVSEMEAKGGIVPHAGWYFSGRVALEVIHGLKGRDDPDVVIIFGIHLHPDALPSIMAKGAWDTPLGPLEIHEPLAAALMTHVDFEIETARQFTPDNTIEVQLPFIKACFPAARIIPIGAPPHLRSVEIGKLCAETALGMGLRIKVIGSTDLTHYGPNYGFTPKGGGDAAVEWVKQHNDRQIIDAICAMDPERTIREAIQKHNACCSGAAAAAISAAGVLGAKSARLLTYTTSHDRHPGDSYVGYAGIVFE